MYLVLWVLLLWIVFVHTLNIYVSGAATLLYALWYLDGKEYSGERHWPQFRRFVLWRWLSPMLYYVANAVELEQQQQGGKLQRLYVLRPGNTYFSVLWGVGLHGGRLPPKMSERLHWVVPPLLMAIPLLRDILLWAGAVTYHERKRPLLDVLLGLLNSNRSICYCPAQYANTLGEEATLTTIHCDALLGFARENHAQIVPMVVSGERARYHIPEHPQILRVQRWMLRNVGYPFPMLVALRCFAHKKPPPLALQIGTIMHCASYDSLEALRASLNTNLNSLLCEEMGDEDKVEMV
jgi:hypothetical protein